MDIVDFETWNQPAEPWSGLLRSSTAMVLAHGMQADDMKAVDSAPSNAVVALDIGMHFER